jgi:Iap family predicted aminopeptidase
MDTASHNPTPAEPATQPVPPRWKPVVIRVTDWLASRLKPLVIRATDWLAPRWTAIYRIAVIGLLAYIAFKPIYVEDGDIWVRGSVDVARMPSVSVDSLPEPIRVFSR